MVVKRVHQLDRTINAVLANEIPNIPANEVKRIFPVIASMEPMHWTPMLHAYLLREVPGLLQQPGVQALQFLEIEDLEALMSVLGPDSLAHLLGRKIHEAGSDADVQQWFRDPTLAPRPTRAPIVEDRMNRLFDQMIAHLGFQIERSEN